MLIAVPSEAPGGLEAPISAHFGHCAVFTLVQIADDQAGEVRLLPNQGHAQGGCMAPVMLLKEAGVDAMVAGGMGMRPLAGFQQVGIQVFFKEDAVSVGDAIDQVTAGAARIFGPAQTCGGGGGGCHD
jgi:predicted Fe-Mo cluster-binding NifX family protein